MSAWASYDWKMNSYLGLADYYTEISLITLQHPLYYLQTMAIGTLAACYNNPRVFTGVVKIRKVLDIHYKSIILSIKYCPLS